MQRRRFLATPLAGLAAGGHPLWAAAQAGQAAARVIVGFAPGGTGDHVARTLAEQLRLRQFAPAVIVDNRPGAGGVIAIQALKAAAPDGLSLLNTPASVLTILPQTQRKLPFDPLVDLVPVATVSDLSIAVVASAATPVASLGEWLALARRDRQLALYGTSGVGTLSHVLGAVLARRAGVDLVHAPYRGGGPALADVVGGQIPVAIVGLSETLLRAQQDGRVRMLATAGTHRSRFLPAVPTIEEAGFRGVATSDWSAIMAPAGVPAAALERVARQVRAVTEDAAFGTTLGRVCIDPLSLGREQIGARLAAEHQAMGRFVREAAITVEG